jgi:hypothetical protein
LNGESIDRVLTHKVTDGFDGEGHENVSSLSPLCEEFHLQSLSSKFSAFRESFTFKNLADAEARSRISALEEGRSQQKLAMLETRQLQVRRRSRGCKRISREFQSPDGLPQLRASAEAAFRRN